MSLGSGPFLYTLYPYISQSIQIPSLIEQYFEIRFKPHFSVSFRNNILLQSLNTNFLYNIDYFGNFLEFTLKDSLRHDITHNSIYFLNSVLICEFDPNFRSNLDILKDNITSTGLIWYELSNNRIIISQQSQEKIDDNIIQKTNTNDFTENWLNCAPKTNRYLSNSFWNYSWLLHHINHLPAFSPFIHSLISHSRIEKNHEIDLVNYNSLHIIDDLMWYRGDLAIEQLENFFQLFRSSDGMIANRAYLKMGQKQTFDVEFDFSISQPPLWSYMLLELAKFLGNSNILNRFYHLCCQNIQWWEKHRYYPDYGLFGAHLPAYLIGIEVSMPDSPRFFQQYNGRIWKSIPKDQPRDMLLIDLNSQIADYYQNLGVIGSILGDENASTYFQKAEQIQDRAQELLWDEKTKFYYDFDLETQTLQPLKSSAAFWSLFGGLVSKGKIDHICNHLTNFSEFGTELPYPAMSSDYQNFLSKEIWNGTVCLSQHYWLLIGLKRYGMSNLGSKIVEKVIRYLNDSFALYGSIFEFYPSKSFNVNSIKSESDPNFTNRHDYNGQNIIHSLFFRGLLGGEILDDSVTFIPDWTVFNKEINYSLFYRTKKFEAYMSKMKNKILEFSAE